MIAISILSNIHAEPFGGSAPKTGNLGIIGSLDPVAADQAACDLIWQLPTITEYIWEKRINKCYSLDALYS